MDDINQDTPVYRVSMLEEEEAAATNIMDTINLVSRRRAKDIDDMTYMMDQFEFKESDSSQAVSHSLAPVTKMPDLRYDETDEWHMIPRGEDGFIHLNIFGSKTTTEPVGFRASTNGVQLL